MSNQEIIQKAWDKAYANGWDFGAWKEKYNFSSSPMVSEYHYNDLLFNHDFAKALWGEKDIMQECTYCKTPMGFQHPNPCPFASLSQVRPLLSVWRYHLQQMVIAEDPIAYLGDTI